MKSDLQRKPRRRQRGRTYGPEVDDTLRVIHESLDCICAERLALNLVWMVEHLARHDVAHSSAGVVYCARPRNIVPPLR